MTNASLNFNRAIVIGASVGGLLAARALAKHFREVIVLERDEFSEGPSRRRGVPQTAHYHTMLGLGQQKLDGWFPGFGTALVEAGAVKLSHSRDCHAYMGGGLRVRFDSPLELYACSRALLEHQLRRFVLQIKAVEIRAGASVAGLCVSGGRIVGVKLENDTTLDADLVVDATGRAARSMRWLPDLGFEVPVADEVTVEVGYASCEVLWKDDNSHDFRFAMVGTDPPQRLGVVSPLEGGRWVVTLVGYFGDHPPKDKEGFIAYARSLPSAVIGKILEEHEFATDISAHRMASSQWRRVDRWKQPPPGLLFFGDSICSLNPVYGQGMMSSALQSEVLEKTLDQFRGSTEDLAKAFYKATVKPINMLWQMAAGGDMTLPKTTSTVSPPPKFLANLMTAYMARVMKAGRVSERVALPTLEITHLLRSPAELLAPRMIWDVMQASKQVR